MLGLALIIPSCVEYFLLSLFVLDLLVNLLVMLIVNSNLIYFQMRRKG